MSAEVALVNVSGVFGGSGATSVGIILGPGALGDFGDNQRIVIVGDAIANHGPSPHAAAVMVSGSLLTFANGIGICRLGDFASCGCQIVNADSDLFCD